MEGATSPMADIITAIQTGLTSVSTNAVDVLEVIVPIALGIFAITWVVRKALKWFNSLAR